MTPVDRFFLSGFPAWGPEPSRNRTLLLASIAVLLLGLGLLGFLVGRASQTPPVETFGGAAQFQPQPGPLAPQDSLLPTEAPATAGGQPVLPPPGAESAAGVTGTFSEAPRPASSLPSPNTVAEVPPSAIPRELPVQVAGEPALRVNATFESRVDNSGGAGFLIRGSVTNPTANRIERVVLTFTGTGAIVASRAAFETPTHPPDSTSSSPAVQPYWNRQVILAYQASVLYDLGPGEARPFEFVAPTNLKNPPGLRAGEVVQSGQPEEVSLLVRAEQTEGAAPSAAPVFPFQRP